MKKVICIFVIFVGICFSANGYAMDISALSAVVIDGDHSVIIYDKDAHSRRTMASTTKIMTAICALEYGNPEKEVEIAPEAVGIEGSSIYLRKGEKLTLKELVYGLMLNSGNDAAVAIAYAVSGSVDEFAKLMNKKAKEIGTENTQFKNPNGLDEDGHYTTAYDLAKITAYGLKNEEFKQIVSTYQATIPGSEDNTLRYLTNHNKLLKRMEGCIGVKTGFTKKSGRCLVSAAERNGITLVAVTLNASDDWNDHIAMMNYAYERVEPKKLVKKGDIMQKIEVINGEENIVDVVCKDDFEVAAVEGKCYVTKYKAKAYMAAPVKKGEIVGMLEFYLDGNCIGNMPALAAQTVEEDKTRYFKKSLSVIAREYFGKNR